MKNERWAQVDRLLDEALERAPRERAAFLATACADDEELRREVASLLVAHDQAAGSFLKVPALEVAAQKLAAHKQPSLIGQTISHYSVISVLGVGGMGEVYLARDTKLDRKVALKFLPPFYTAAATRVERFEREARAASALNHPNILTIYEIGKTAGKHFIAAEYVEGRTLRELLKHGCVPVKDALEIAIQIAGALAATHEAGIVHRDIKPENVMQRRDGYVKVLDFGLVKLIERPRSREATNAGADDVGRTNPGTVLGTISYMSPEQALGRDVDRRSDIFSLGVLLYELVTGAQPFKGHTTAALLDAIVHHPHLPITQLHPDLPGELERIITRALEKDRELRYQSASDLRAELKRLQRELDSAAMVQISGPAQSKRAEGAPRRWVTAALAAVAAGAVLLAAWVLWRTRSAGSADPSPWDKAPVLQVTEHTDVENYPSLAPDGESLVYARKVNEQWDIYWQRIGGSKTQSLTAGVEADDTSPAYSHDGARIAFRSERDGGGLYMMGATGENVRRLTAGGFNPTWSPDDREVVYSTARLGSPNYQINVDGYLEVINLATEAKRRVAGSEGALQPSWSPRGHRIAYWVVHSGSQRDIWTIPAQGGRPVPVTNDAAVDWCPVWAPDGKHLYFVSARNGRQNLWRVAIDEETGRTLGELELVPTASPYSTMPSFSADGRRLAYLQVITRATVRRIAFDPVREMVTGPPIRVTQVARRPSNPHVSPDGQWVTYYAFGEPQMDIFVVKSDGSEPPRQLTNDKFIDRQPRFSPTGERLAFYSDASGHNEIWLMNRDGSGRRQLTFTTGRGVLDPVWSPDGTRLAYSRRTGGSFIMEVDKPWQEQTPEELPPLGDGEFVAEGWSSTGERIAGVRLRSDNVAPGVMMYTLATRQYEQATKVGEFAQWLADSKRLLFDEKGKIYLFNTQTRALKELYSIPSGEVFSPRLARDERQLYFIMYEDESDIFLLNRK